MSKKLSEELCPKENPDKSYAIHYVKEGFMLSTNPYINGKGKFIVDMKMVSIGRESVKLKVTREGRYWVSRYPNEEKAPNAEDFLSRL